MLFDDVIFVVIVVVVAVAAVVVVGRGDKAAAPISHEAFGIEYEARDQLLRIYFSIKCYQFR